jgi:hypothetical protein
VTEQETGQVRFSRPCDVDHSLDTRHVILKVLDIEALAIGVAAAPQLVNHRPRSSVLLFARLMGKQYAGTPLAKYFINDEAETK